MPIRLVTFDCAQTLVDVEWTVDGFAAACAADVGLDAPADAFARYRQLYFARLPEFLQVNLTRDPALGQAFWDRLLTDWLAAEGLDPAWAAPLTEASDRLGFGPDSILFRIYEDVVPCLDRLKSTGIQTAVVSNWDYSLHRVLDMLGIRNRFDAVLASLEEGVEKPDPRLFHLCLQRLNVAPEETLHVGDNPLDDGEGARAAGIRPVIIDRSGNAGDIRSLEELAWND